MTVKKMIFNDGSCIEWLDKESVKYTEGEHAALLWVDFEPGLFSRGRVLAVDSLRHWTNLRTGISEATPPEKQVDIIGKVRQYYIGRLVSLREDA